MQRRMPSGRSARVLTRVIRLLGVGQHTRREFSIGERVRVALDRVDPLERKLQFSLVEPVRRSQRKGKRKVTGPYQGDN